MLFIFVAPRFHTNQAPIIKRLVELGNEVRFFVVEREFSEDYSVLAPTIIKPSIIYSIFKKTFRIPASKDRRILFPSIRFMWKGFKTSEKGVIIIRNPHYVYSFVSLVIGNLMQTCVIIYSQDPLYSNKPTARQFFYRFLANCFNVKWITPVRGNMEHRRVSKHQEYVPLVVSNRESYVSTVKREGFSLLMVGKFLDWKRHDLLVLAISKLVNKGYNVKTTIIGECSKPEHKCVFGGVKKMIRDLHLSENIHLITNLPYNKMNRHYREAELFVLPSVDERYSISPLEAMSNGLPVIVSTGNGFQFCIKDGYNGFVFDKDSLDSLVEKIKILLDKDRLKVMRKNCLSYVEQHHAPDIYIKKIIKIAGLE